MAQLGRFYNKTWNRGLGGRCKGRLGIMDWAQLQEGSGSAQARHDRSPGYIMKFCRQHCTQIHDRASMVVMGWEWLIACLDRVG